MTAAEASSSSPKQCWIWQCQQCQRECVPIRSQSRCLCGHRLASHDSSTHACTTASCKCPRFNFIVAEGAWILKCRCKHKHTDHTTTAPHACSKGTCSCTGFDSPWVCNCDHPWAQHQQLLVTRQVMRLEDMVAQAQQQRQQQQPRTAAPAPAPGQARAAAAVGLQAHAAAVTVAEGDLACEVNRFDLLQRGKKA